MYSDALRIMDQNMVKYMIDELKAELSAQKVALSQKDSALSQKDSEIERLRTQLAKYEARTDREYSE